MYVNVRLSRCSKEELSWATDLDKQIWVISNEIFKTITRDSMDTRDIKDTMDTKKVGII